MTAPLTDDQLIAALNGAYSTVFARSLARQAAARLSALRDMLEMAVTDQLRYRLLREYLDEQDGELILTESIPCHAAPNVADIDAAIDRAMTDDR